MMIIIQGLFNKETSNLTKVNQDFWSEDFLEESFDFKHLENKLLSLKGITDCLINFTKAEVIFSKLKEGFLKNITEFSDLLIKIMDDKVNNSLILNNFLNYLDLNLDFNDKLIKIKMKFCIYFSIFFTIFFNLFSRIETINKVLKNNLIHQISNYIYSIFEYHLISPLSLYSEFFDELALTSKWTKATKSEVSIKNVPNLLTVKSNLHNLFIKDVNYIPYMCKFYAHFCEHVEYLTKVKFVYSNKIINNITDRYFNYFKKNLESPKINNYNNQSGLLEDYNKSVLNYNFLEKLNKDINMLIFLTNSVSDRGFIAMLEILNTNILKTVQGNIKEFFEDFCKRNSTLNSLMFNERFDLPEFMELKENKEIIEKTLYKIYSIRNDRVEGYGSGSKERDRNGGVSKENTNDEEKKEIEIITKVINEGKNTEINEGNNKEIIEGNNQENINKEKIIKEYITKEISTKVYSNGENNEEKTKEINAKENNNIIKEENTKENIKEIHLKEQNQNIPDSNNHINISNKNNKNNKYSEKLKSIFLSSAITGIFDFSCSKSLQNVNFIINSREDIIILLAKLCLKFNESINYIQDLIIKIAEGSNNNQFIKEYMNYKKLTEEVNTYLHIFYI